MEALHKYLRVSGPEEMNELRKIASRFEEKIFSDAVNLVTLPPMYILFPLCGFLWRFASGNGHGSRRYDL